MGTSSYPKIAISILSFAWLVSFTNSVQTNDEQVLSGLSLCVKSVKYKAISPCVKTSGGVGIFGILKMSKSFLYLKVFFFLSCCLKQKLHGFAFFGSCLFGRMIVSWANLPYLQSSVWYLLEWWFRTTRWSFFAFSSFSVKETSFSA